MRAAYYEANGPARDVLRVGTIETPQPGPGEVRVRLAASGVNPSDVKARAGHTRKIAFPLVIPHSDGAGVVDAIGDGVPPSRLGERVWIWNGQWRRPFGTCAEYVTLPAELTVRLPDHIGFEIGACLGVPAITGYHAVAMAESWAGSTLLISGGAGQVAQYAIQFAKARGAVVIATVSSELKADQALAAGADHVVDYKREDVAAAVMDLTDSAGVDAVIEVDIAANADLLPKILRPRGTVVVYGTGKTNAPFPFQTFLTSQLTLKFIFVYEISSEERQEAISVITQMMEDNRLRHTVALALPLDEVAAAHEAVESGSTLGKVVVKLP